MNDKRDLSYLGPLACPFLFDFCFLFFFGGGERWVWFGLFGFGGFLCRRGKGTNRLGEVLLS